MGTDVVDLLRAISRHAELRQVVHDADLHTAPPAPEPDVVEPYRWFLARIGDGVTLTGAGHLPPALVAETMHALGWDADWIGAGNRENLTVPVADLRESARRLGLVRVYRNELRPTTVGRRLVDDPAGLWQHLAAQLPTGRSASDRTAGLLWLLGVAAGRAHPEDAVAAGMTVLGWVSGDTGRPLDRHTAFLAVRDTTWTVFDRLGLLGKRYRDEPPTPSAVALARAALLHDQPPAAGRRVPAVELTPPRVIPSARTSPTGSVTRSIPRPSTPPGPAGGCDSAGRRADGARASATLSPCHPSAAPASCCSAVPAAGSRCSSGTWAARSGRRRTTAPGRSPRKSNRPHEERSGPPVLPRPVGHAPRRCEHSPATREELQMNPVLAHYLHERPWSEGRTRRMVAGLRILQELARTGDRPVTYKEFAEQLQPGLAPLAASRVLADIGQFCNHAGWPNVTCFVVSATTGECSPGCRQIGDEGPVVARERARVADGMHGDGPSVDPVRVDATGR